MFMLMNLGDSICCVGSLWSGIILLEVYLSFSFLLLCHSIIESFSFSLFWFLVIII